MILSTPWGREKIQAQRPNVVASSHCYSHTDVTPARLAYLSLMAGFGIAGAPIKTYPSSKQTYYEWFDLEKQHTSPLFNIWFNTTTDERGFESNRVDRFPAGLSLDGDTALIKLAVLEIGAVNARHLAKSDGFRWQFYEPAACHAFDLLGEEDIPALARELDRIFPGRDDLVIPESAKEHFDSRVEIMLNNQQC